MSGTVESNEFIFSDDKVSVSKTLVKTGSHSYPINGIGSVNVVRPHFASVLWAVVCVGFTVWLASQGEIAGGGILAGLGIAAVLFGYGMQVVLIFRTASGNQHALTSYDSNYLARVQRAIEDAVTRRG